MKNKSFYIALTIVVLLAFTARVVVLSSSAGNIGNPDGHDYVNIAQSLSEGHGFAYKTDDPKIVFRTFTIDNLDKVPEYQATATRPPLICFLMAACFKCGLSLKMIQFIFVLISTSSVALVFYFVSSVSQSLTRAVLAACLLAFNPFSVFLSSEIGTEVLFEFLILSCIVQSHICLTEKKSTWKVGILLGLLILCRPTGLMIALFSSIALLIFKRDRLKQELFIPNTVALLVILPWIIRCSLLFGTLVPVTSYGGLTFWLSWVRAEHFEISEIKDGFYAHGTSKIQKDIHNMNEVQISNYLKKDAFKRVIRQPNRFFPVLSQHLVDLVRIRSKGVHRDSVLSYACASYLVILYSLSLISCWQSLKARRILLIFVSVFLLTHVIAVCHIRHRNALIDATCAIAVGVGLSRKKLFQRKSNCEG
jgi:4-amino-4-deoxy-L-arabinose transferase-like glycosyltransferase